jgi:hypothetical protein
LGASVRQTSQIVRPEGAASRPGELSAVSVPVATPKRQQRKGRSMSRRSGQTGSLSLVGQKWYGRYRRDVPGKEKREHPLVVLGHKSSMTKPEARS